MQWVNIYEAIMNQFSGVCTFASPGHKELTYHLSTLFIHIQSLTMLYRTDTLPVNFTETMITSKTLANYHFYEWANYRVTSGTNDKDNLTNYHPPGTPFNTLRPSQNGRHFADDYFKYIFFTEKIGISIESSLKFVPQGRINNTPALVQIQYIPRNMHKVFALLCFVVVIHWLIFPYPSGLLHWHCGNLTIAPVPAKQPWWIWINTSCEFIMNDCITTTKQSTTKPCAYFLGYTVMASLGPNELMTEINWDQAMDK